MNSLPNFSAEAAQAALPNNTVERRPHPPGGAGSKMSLEKVASLVREGRNDPRVRAWAGKALIAAGRPTRVTDQAQAVLDAFHKQVMYVPDPVHTEMMAKPHVTLCLDDKGLCMPISDCDDAVIAVASALMSIGIQTEIIGQAFNGDPSASHVILAVKDPLLGRLRIDPSEKNYRVGNYHPATKEWILDPMETSHASLAAPQEGGEFVGVGSKSCCGSCARGGPCQDECKDQHLSGGAQPSGEFFPGAVGNIPWMGNNAFDPPPGVPRGLSWEWNKLGQATTASSSVPAAVYSAVMQEMQAAVFALERTRNNLGASLQQITQTRASR